MKRSPILFLSILLLLGVRAFAATTWHVDFESGDDTRSGKSPEESWKHAPGDPQATSNPAGATLAPGDTVLFRGGVIYRGSIAIPASGQPDSLITYKGTGWGEGRAILDGSEPLAGWKPCASPEDAGGRADFQNLFFTEVEASSPFLLNLHELTPDGTDEFLWIAQDPNPKQPFFPDRTDSFYEVTRENLTSESVTAPEVFTSKDPNHFQGASAYVCCNPNVTRRMEILSYDPAASRITFEDLGASALYADGRKQYYAIVNSVHAIDQPGDFAVGLPGANGKRRVVLHPRNSKDLDDRISHSVRKQGFFLGKQSHVAIDGFVIRKFAGEDNTGGGGIATATRGVGSKGNYLISNNLITHNYSGGKGHGGVYLDDTVDAVVENNEITWNASLRAIFVTGGDRIIIRKNRVANVGRTAVVMYTGKRSQILDNHISQIYGTHANALTLYVACENVLVAGNVITDATTPITFQDSGHLYFINNITDGIGKYKNVNEWPNTKRGPWTVGPVVFLNNTFVNADAHSSLSLGKDPEKEYVIVNNILDGLSLSDKGAKITRSHNMYTGLNNFQADRYGWALGEGESDAVDPSALFVNPEERNFRLLPSAPAVGKGADVSAHYPRDVFPDIDFDRIGGVTRPMNIGATPPVP